MSDLRIPYVRADGQKEAGQDQADRDGDTDGCVCSAVCRFAGNEKLISMKPRIRSGFYLSKDILK